MQIMASPPHATSGRIETAKFKLGNKCNFLHAQPSAPAQAKPKAKQNNRSNSDGRRPYGMPSVHGDANDGETKEPEAEQDQHERDRDDNDVDDYYGEDYDYQDVDGNYAEEDYADDWVDDYVTTASITREQLKSRTMPMTTVQWDWQGIPWQ